MAADHRGHQGESRTIGVRKKMGLRLNFRRATATTPHSVLHYGVPGPLKWERRSRRAAAAHHGPETNSPRSGPDLRCCESALSVQHSILLGIDHCTCRRWVSILIARRSYPWSQTPQRTSRGSNLSCDPYPAPCTRILHPGARMSPPTSSATRRPIPIGRRRSRRWQIG